MTTITKKQTPNTDTAAQPAPYRFTVTEYHRMAKAGIFTEDDRVELIDGEIIAMTALGPTHMAQVNQLNSLLVRKSDPNCIVSVQNSVRLGRHQEPQPDLLLLREDADKYKHRHPTAEDVLLLIEVSDTTLRYDQTRKLALYAKAGIREYWILNLPERYLEIYTEPEADTYHNTRIARRGDTVTTPALPGITLSVDEILV